MLIALTTSTQGRFPTSLYSVSLFVMVTGLLSPAAFAVEDNPAGLELFEKRIRPMFVQHCAACHSDQAVSAGKLKGGLNLDHKSGWEKGGDSGPAIVPGKANESLLYQTLTFEHGLDMPPKGKLPDQVIQDVARWINLGAPDPRIGKPAAKQTGMSISEGRRFWAYQPITKPSLPSGNIEWSSQPIDRFIADRMTQHKLSLASEADRHTWLRRVSYTLTGLPPTVEEINAFINDQSADARINVVDRLLASPRFADHWARHWFDVSRYAESVTLRGLIFKDAWRYRDYVVDSFHQDRAFDQFVREQIAGDLLPANAAADRERQLIATTYLMLGNTNFEEQNKKQLRMDFVDEQLDVIGKGLLAQTITCARCHDHKFDPIPTSDYYALAGILRNIKAMEHENVSKWVERPLPVSASEQAEYAKLDRAIAELQEKINRLKKQSQAKVTGVVAISSIAGIVVDDANAKKVGFWKSSTTVQSYVGTSYVHDDNADKGAKTLTFTPTLPRDGQYEVLFAYVPGASRAKNAPVTVFSAAGEKTVLVDMTKQPADGRFISLGTFPFERSGQSFVIVSNEGTTGHVTADCVSFVAQDTANSSATSERSPAAASKQPSVKSLEAQLKQLKESTAARPMAMAPQEEPIIEDCRVHIRGQVSTLGDVVPRGFLQVACAETSTVPTLPKTQSGRVELANWLTDPHNPLTARVYVNRVWHWVMGSGLVRTVDNFGTTGESPSHPELLDYLTADFIQHGWSTKKLVRQMVLSKTFALSATHPSAEQLDPENRYFARSIRRRVDAESIRDAMLLQSGKLQLTKVTGPTYPKTLASDYGYKQSSDVRTVYLPQFRNGLPDIQTIFDGADSSVVTGARNRSTVAPQALYFLNNKDVLAQATLTAERLLKETSPDGNREVSSQGSLDAKLLDRTYLTILGRLPTSRERIIMTQFMADYPSQKSALTGLIHALWSSAEFRLLN